MKQLLQRLKSKTYWLAIVVGVLGAVQIAWPTMLPVMGEKLFGWTTLIIGVAVALLREVTREPLQDK